MNKAVDILIAIGVDPTSSKFYEECHFIASNLCRVSDLLESGHLAVNAKQRSAAPQQ